MVFLLCTLNPLRTSSIRLRRVILLVECVEKGVQIVLSVNACRIYAHVMTMLRA